MKASAIAFAFMALVANAASAASAQTPAAPDGSAPVVVRVSDLDLGRPQGAQVAVARIRQAAHVFCGAQPSPLSLGEYLRYGACVDESVTATVRQLGAPLVTATEQAQGRAQQLASR